MSKHTNGIFKTTYNELRPTTIVFQLPRHPPSRKHTLYLVLRWGGVTPIYRALLRFCRYTIRGSSQGYHDGAAAYACVPRHAHAHTDICAASRAHARTRNRKRAHTHAHAVAHAHPHTHMQSLTHTLTRAHSHTHTRPHTRMYMRPHIYAYTCACTYVYTRTNVPTHKRTHCLRIYMYSVY